MVLEFEKSYKYVMYPENLKSYANIDNKGVCTVKGVPFNKYTLEFRDSIYNVFTQILTNNTDKTP